MMVQNWELCELSLNGYVRYREKRLCNIFSVNSVTDPYIVLDNTLTVIHFQI